MKSYQDLKKLDEESLQKIRESSGPSDQCICNLLSPPEKKSFTRSLKNALGITKKKGSDPRSVKVNLNTEGTGWSGHKKEVVKRKSSCGKCGCDDTPMVLRHSYANIRITSPDLSSVCPCSSNCLPDRERLQNNLKVIIEHAQIPSSPLKSQSAQLHQAEDSKDDRI